MKNYIFWIKKRRAFDEEAHTTKITRDTVLSLRMTTCTVYYFEVIYVEKGGY